MLGEAGKAWCGEARQGEAWHGRRGVARFGRARRGRLGWKGVQENECPSYSLILISEMSGRLGVSIKIRYAIGGEKNAANAIQ